VRWIEAFTALTSANYARGDLAASTILGENVNATRVWDRGNPPTRRPQKPSAGNLIELQTGCLGDGTPPAGYYDVEGIDSRCYSAAPRYTLATFADLDPENPAVLLMLAQLLEWSYTDPAAAAAWILFWLGPGVTVNVVANDSSLYPGSIIIQHPLWTIVIISGTSNPQQLALQAAYSLAGPINFGPYSTMPLWQQAAVYIATLMEAAGVNPVNPVLIAGHSYGGAVATVLTEILRRGNTERPLRLVTFGAPAPGDGRLQRGLRAIPQWHFSTQNDPVPQMPFTGTNVYGLQAVVSAGLRAAWAQWQAPALLRLVGTDDGFPPLQTGNLAWLMLLAIAQAVAAGRPTDPFPEHSISYYLLLLRAMNPSLLPWPIPAPVKALMVQANNWTIVDAGRLQVYSLF